MNNRILGKRQKKYKTLAIIGNGFDLAHNYKTSYEAFIKNVSSESLDTFKIFCNEYGDIVTWYSFEENIMRLTHELFQQSYNENYDFEAIRRSRALLQDVYIDIHNQLMEYLKQEMESKPVIKLSAVKKYLKRKTKVISFNYTNVAKAYSNEVFFVHGSIDEKDILLGYDYREEPCIAEYEDVQWSKDICREALAFRRYLKNELYLTQDSQEYIDRITGFKAYQSYENSGRGIDDEVKSLIQHYELVEQFIKNYRELKGIPNINYSKITTIAVLGHGIEADRVFLQSIMKECVNLKKVVIYRYADESDDSYNLKAKFFKDYCKKIRCIDYR